jgi:hypothetical protein
MAAAVHFEILTDPVLPPYQGIPSFERSTWIEIGMFADVPANTILATIVGGGHVADPAVVAQSLQNGIWGGGDVKGGANGVHLLNVSGNVNVDTPVPVEPGNPLFTFLVHIDGEYSDIIIIDDLNGPNPFFPPTPPPSINTKLNAAVVDCPPIEIHVTPEPMTLALLGLGGLFLRRRK